MIGSSTPFLLRAVSLLCCCDLRRVSLSFSVTRFRLGHLPSSFSRLVIGPPCNTVVFACLTRQTSVTMSLSVDNFKSNLLTGHFFLWLAFPATSSLMAPLLYDSVNATAFLWYYVLRWNKITAVKGFKPFGYTYDSRQLNRSRFDLDSGINDYHCKRNISVHDRLHVLMYYGNITCIVIYFRGIYSTWIP